MHKLSRKVYLSSFYTIWTLLFFTSCFNNGKKAMGTDPLQKLTGSLASPSAGDQNKVANGKSKFVIDRADFFYTLQNEGTLESRIDPSKGGSIRFYLNLDQTQPAKAKIADFCTGSSDKSSVFQIECQCEFTWTSKISDRPVEHSPVSVASIIKSDSIECPAPVNFYSNLESGTELKIKVSGTTSNSKKSEFEFEQTFVKFEVNKGSARKVTSGNLTDSFGNEFESVLRYSCFSKQNNKSLKLYSARINTHKLADNTPVLSLSGTQFCNAETSKSGSSIFCDSIEDIRNTAPNAYYGPSTISYYQSLYIPKSKRSHMLTSNDGYACPKVSESLWGNGSDFYPMDQTFMLSKSLSLQFPVGVPALSYLGRDGNSTNSFDKKCMTTIPSSSQKSSTATAETIEHKNASQAILQDCMGYAALPNSRGECSAITLSDGSKTPTYRLRRYYARFPLSFLATGFPTGENQKVDTLYVLDRPVANGGTRTGPKSCPFAWANEKNGILTYNGTNNVEAWDKKNPDGTEFPHLDAKVLSGDPFNIGSCSASLPVFHESESGTSVPPQIGWKTFMPQSNPSDTDSNAKDLDYRRAIRPMQPWAPHYEEDVNFLACAPAPQGPAPEDTLKDPPLHFGKKGGSATPLSGTASTEPDSNPHWQAWCAEAYPNAHSYYGEVSTLTPGTTPEKKIRKMTFEDGTQGNKKKFPLLAPDTDIESALNLDPSYGCNYTSVKDQLVDKPTYPKEGCCKKASPTSPLESRAETTASGAVCTDPGQ